MCKWRIRTSNIATNYRDVYAYEYVRRNTKYNI